MGKVLLLLPHWPSRNVPYTSDLSADCSNRVAGPSPSMVTLYKLVRRTALVPAQNGSSLWSLYPPEGMCSVADGLSTSALSRANHAAVSAGVSSCRITNVPETPGVAGKVDAPG